MRVRRVSVAPSSILCCQLFPFAHQLLQVILGLGNLLAGLAQPLEGFRVGGLLHFMRQALDVGFLAADAFFNALQRFLAAFVITPIGLEQRFV